MAEHRVRLEGTVLYSDVEWNLLFLADRTGSIFVNTRGLRRGYVPGTRIVLEGRTAAGHVKSNIVDPEIRVIGSGSLPAPPRYSLAQLDGGAADSALVEIHGVLRPGFAAWDRVSYRLFEGDSWASVVVPTAKSKEADMLVGATVRVRGVSGLLPGPGGTRLGTQLFVNDLASIVVEEPASSDPFSLAVVSIGELPRLSAEAVRRNVLVRGAVTWVQGRYFLLEDATGSVCAELPEGAAPRLGQVVIVAGYPDRGVPGLILANARFRDSGSFELAPRRPVERDARDLAMTPMRGQLVKVSGQLIEQTSTAKAHRYLLESGGVRFLVLLGKRGEQGTIQFTPGAQMEVTGLATTSRGGSSPESFTVAALAPANIASHPPRFRSVFHWLGPVLGGSVLIALAASLWVVQLRRTVRRQTEVLRQAMARAVDMASRDSLTGLPNRRKFAEELDAAMAQLADGDAVTLMYADLDGFKLVNDSLGHAVGDELLVEVARRLESQGGGRVFRLGGDEFCILLTGHRERASLERMAIETLSATSAPFVIAGHEVVIGASLGIADSTGGAVTPAGLLQRADNAMYSAKRQGRNRFEFFSEELGFLLRERTNLELQLRGAIGRGEIFVVYQPEFDAETRDLVRFEALLRWRHPTLGDVSPSIFIPVAEESGLIAALGAFVMQQACLEAREWAQLPGTPVQVAVNVSSVQFRREGFVDEVAGVLRATGIDPRLVQLELTESVALGGTQHCAAVMQRLKDLGVSLAIDDFGTGYSSLSYLHALPFDALKLDRGFVTGIEEKPERESLVRSIISLAVNVGLRVIVEGVETPGELEAIRRAGGHEVQGFLLGKPMKEPRILFSGLRSVDASRDLASLMEATRETSPAGPRSPESIAR